MLTIAIRLFLSDYRLLSGLSMPFWSGNDFLQFSHNLGFIYSIISNSTWIADDQPCITYGLRGVVHCALEVILILQGSSAILIRG